MKAIRIIAILSLFTLASAAYVWMRSAPDAPSESEPGAVPVEPRAVTRIEAAATNTPPEEGLAPVQPLEERGDAMLFEIEALQNTPFDEAVVKPYD